MKTLILLILLATAAHGQIEQVASSTENGKGVPIAYFVDMGSIVFANNEVRFTGLMTGIKSWKEEFEIDTSEYFLVSEIWANCNKKTWKELKRSGRDGELVNYLFPNPLERSAPEGTVIATTIKKVCGSTKKLIRAE